MHIRFGSSVVAFILLLLLLLLVVVVVVIFVVYLRCCHSMVHRKISDEGNGPQLWSLRANIGVVTTLLRIVDKRLFPRLVLGLPLTTLLHNESSRHWYILRIGIGSIFL
jgi:hypothetical protein